MKTKKEDLWKFPSVKRYLADNKAVWWTIGVFLLIAYGIKVFNVSISHDTEQIMSTPEVLYDNWYTMGRFGLIFIKRILGTYVFNPYAASFMMFVMMILNSWVWTYLFYWLGSQEKNTPRNGWIFPTVLFTSTIYVEQSGFLLQIYEINTVLLLVGLALIGLYKVILEKKAWYWFLPEIVICVLAFSAYQSFVPLFAAGAALSFLLVYDKCIQEGRESASVKFLLSLIGKLIAVFILSLLVYKIINTIVLNVLHMETTSYITDQIMWGKIPAKQCIMNIISHIYSALIGKGVFYTPVYGMVYLFLLCYFLFRFKDKERNYFLCFFALLFCLASPFLMTVLLGTAPTARTEFLLPFVVGFFLQYGMNRFFVKEEKRRKYAYVCAVILVGCFVMNQSLLSSRLFYTQYVQYEEDVRLAVKITDRIDQLNLGESPEEPVVFVGRREPQKNAVALKGEELELIGRSFFEVSFYTGHGTRVMHHFLETLGYSYNLPTDEQTKTAQELAADMPCWPDTGSVAVKDGVIVIKLSD